MSNAYDSSLSHSTFKRCQVKLQSTLAKTWRGAAVALVIAIAAVFLSEHYGAPAMLFALLIGLALGFLAEQESMTAGLSFTSTQVLRFGVGLLGIQLSFEDVQTLGVVSVGGVFAMVIATLLCGVVLSFAVSRRFAFGILSGGAVAVCGASAALAFSAVLPAHPKRETDTVLVVIGVTVLSTVAMVAYPILCKLLKFNEVETGFLIGATIHDVAQVVGAGYSVSENTGIIATLVKMLRVASLPILVVAVHLIFSDSQDTRARVPWFLILFFLLAITRSVIPIPPEIVEWVSSVSRWLLLAAIAAIGLCTNLSAVVRVHPSLLFILFIETLFILGLAIAYVINVL